MHHEDKIVTKTHPEQLKDARFLGWTTIEYEGQILYGTYILSLGEGILRNFNNIFVVAVPADPIAF